MPAGHVDRVWRRRSEWIGERKISEEMTEIVRLGSRSARDMQFRIRHPLMHQNITGFHLDDEQDWVAELECATLSTCVTGRRGSIRKTAVRACSVIPCNARSAISARRATVQ